MKFHTLLIVGLALGATGCAEKEQVASEAVDATETGTESVVADAPVVEEEGIGTTEFLAHMHHHASQLEQLNAALAIGSIEAAQRPAYWLSGHDEIGGVPAEWQVFVEGMRDGANAVAGAPDIAGARAAAQRITDNCEGCHTAAAVDVPSLVVD